mmetsp:Transcript_7793/g.30861  ORF Transcript_7793/g.30861 Transcript_7793/m.30861 type:complete len:445 (-) Transcript_7793:97-1431(-)
MQRAQRLFHVVGRRGAARDHERKGGTPEGVHEQLGELTVAVGDVVVLLAIRQHGDHLAQHEQRAVDVPGLLDHVPLALTALQALGPGEIHKANLAKLAHRHAVAVGVRLDVDRHHGVRPRRVLVELVAAHPAIPRAPRDDRERVVEARAVDGDEIGNVKTPLRLPPLRQLPLVISRQQVVDGLVVDFEVGALDPELDPGSGAVHRGEDVRERTGHDAVVAAPAGPVLPLDQFLASAHAERLARTRLSVREDGGGVSVQRAVQQSGNPALDHHLGLRRVRREARVEIELAHAVHDGQRSLIVRHLHRVALPSAQLPFAQRPNSDDDLDRAARTGTAVAPRGRAPGRVGAVARGCGRAPVRAPPGDGAEAADVGGHVARVLARHPPLAHPVAVPRPGARRVRPRDPARVSVNRHAVLRGRSHGGSPAHRASAVVAPQRARAPRLSR